MRAPGRVASAWLVGGVDEAEALAFAEAVQEGEPLLWRHGAKLLDGLGHADCGLNLLRRLAVNAGEQPLGSVGAAQVVAGASLDRVAVGGHDLVAELLGRESPDWSPASA